MMLLFGNHTHVKSLLHNLEDKYSNRLGVANLAIWPAYQDPKRWPFLSFYGNVVFTHCVATY